MKYSVDIEFIGLGDRGLTALRLLLQSARHLPLRITALRDTDPARVRAAQELVAASDNLQCDASSDGAVNLTYISTDWESHAPLALDAMRRGRHVAIEVPAALTLADIRELVATSLHTGCHCFMLENCCYDPPILDAIARIRGGEIGEVVHAEGTYYHTLGERWTPWRLEMNRRQRGDLYPTHELAPLCMALGVSPARPVDESATTTTDRFATLVCMDSAPLTGPDVYKQHIGAPAPDFLNGDHTTTLIRTALGRTIVLRHDVLTKMPYERLFRVVGTKGTITVSDDGTTPHDVLTTAMNERLIMALAEGRPLDFDVKDLAVWCAVTPLSTLSIERGFAPVAFPVF